MNGASRVVVFDHTLRTADDDDRETRKIREPVSRVHNDYTEWSAPQRVRDLLPQEADDLLSRRFAIVQVWRPIRNPVETFPLAICDARSLSPDDLVISERRYPNRVGQTYAITYNPEHAWYWFPLMRRNEALVFKVYDSLKDGRARWTAHTAFDDPTAPPDARRAEYPNPHAGVFVPIKAGATALSDMSSAIDCDVHPTLPGLKALEPYLEPYWRDSFEERGIPGFEPNAYPPNAPLTARDDFKGKNGRAATEVTAVTTKYSTDGGWARRSSIASTARN